MKIILLEDVKALGKKDQIVEVSDGYARNFILPKKLGVEANAKNMNDLKLQKANEDKKAQQQLEDAKELAALLETKEVVVKMKAGEGGKTFGSISSKEIAMAAKIQCGLDLDKKKIQIPDTIKSLGVYEVSVKLHSQVTGKLKVKVEEEGK
jgi:large subunit ribosomal protein L9